MALTIYHIHAFTDRIFTGNPAAVCLLPSWLAENTLRSIAIENNLPVTAFIVPSEKTFAIRWLTPEYELDLCGHGTLAASFAIFNFIKPSINHITFESKTGTLYAEKYNNKIQLNFPTKPVEQINTSDILIEGLKITPVEVWQHQQERLIVVFDDEDTIKSMQPDMVILKNLAHRGIVVTAPSHEFDFVSRTFYPHKPIPEDAVTGASHCALTPYWSKRLHKKVLTAKQVSNRGGVLECEQQGDRVLLRAEAVLYLQGALSLNE